MLTPIFSFNNEFIKIPIFEIFKYTQRPYFKILEIFLLLKEYPVDIQSSVFNVNYLAFFFFFNFDVAD